jgi:hypothetical protein
MPLHSNYLSNLEQGKEFEAFVFDTMLHERRLVVGGYMSRHYQVLHGESATGVEVKMDMEFRNTGNLFIETMERPSVLDTYKPAGIYHESDPWLMVIGDFSSFWVFATQTLRNYHGTGVCVEVENRSETGKGFLLPVCKADRHKAWKWEAPHGR